MNSGKRTLKAVPNEKDDQKESISSDLDKKKVFRLMAMARALEERLIKMSKSDDGFFWIGGPGEEAFNTCLGLQVKKGEGIDHDYLHLHYRSSAILLALGMNPKDEIRQMANKATDPFSGGRNFANHYSVRRWNVIPVTSTIETQYSIAPGTAIAQRNHGGDAITIVNGGDAGTAEGDFATCLNWASRPGEELPMLIIVTNNRYGISTPFNQVQGAKVIAKRAEAFGIRWDTVDGNDVMASWNKLKEAVAYVRKERKPFMLESFVSRLHGHSSSSGAKRVDDEVDCLDEFQKLLIAEGLFTEAECKRIREDATNECTEALHQVRKEPDVDPGTIYDHTFVEDN